MNPVMGITITEYDASVDKWDHCSRKSYSNKPKFFLTEVI